MKIPYVSTSFTLIGPVFSLQFSLRNDFDERLGTLTKRREPQFAKTVARGYRFLPLPPPRLRLRRRPPSSFAASAAASSVGVAFLSATQIAPTFIITFIRLLRPLFEFLRKARVGKTVVTPLLGKRSSVVRSVRQLAPNRRLSRLLRGFMLCRQHIHRPSQGKEG